MPHLESPTQGKQGKCGIGEKNLLWRFKWLDGDYSKRCNMWVWTQKEKEKKECHLAYQTYHDP